MTGYRVHVEELAEMIAELPSSWSACLRTGPGSGEAWPGRGAVRTLARGEGDVRGIWAGNAESCSRGWCR